MLQVRADRARACLHATAALRHAFSATAAPARAHLTPRGPPSAPRRLPRGRADQHGAGRSVYVSERAHHGGGALGSYEHPLIRRFQATGDHFPRPLRVPWCAVLQVRAARLRARASARAQEGHRAAVETRAWRRRRALLPPRSCADAASARGAAGRSAADVRCERCGHQTAPAGPQSSSMRERCEPACAARSRRLLRSPRLAAAPRRADGCTVSRRAAGERIGRAGRAARPGPSPLWSCLVLPGREHSRMRPIASFEPRTRASLVRPPLPCYSPARAVWLHCTRRRGALLGGRSACAHAPRARAASLSYQHVAPSRRVATLVLSTTIARHQPSAC
jgi:hypothetical protein